jgi:hypothetical protein
VFFILGLLIHVSNVLIQNYESKHFKHQSETLLLYPASTANSNHLFPMYQWKYFALIINPFVFTFDTAPKHTNQFKSESFTQPKRFMLTIASVLFSNLKPMDIRSFDNCLMWLNNKLPVSSFYRYPKNRPFKTKCTGDGIGRFNFVSPGQYQQLVDRSIQ